MSHWSPIPNLYFIYSHLLSICWRMMVSCLPRPFFHLYLSHFIVYLLCFCITLKPHFHTTFHPLTFSSYLLLLSFYSVFLIAGLCPGLFLGVSALIKRPSARISLQPEPTCIFQLLNSDCRQVVTFSLYLPNCSTQTAVCLSLWATGRVYLPVSTGYGPRALQLHPIHPVAIQPLSHSIFAIHPKFFHYRHHLV